MSENRFSTMFKFNFRRKDKKFVSISFRNTYDVFVFIFIYLFTYLLAE